MGRLGPAIQVGEEREGRRGRREKDTGEGDRQRRAVLWEEEDQETEETQRERRLVLVILFDQNGRTSIPLEVYTPYTTNKTLYVFSCSMCTI